MSARKEIQDAVILALHEYWPEARVQAYDEAILAANFPSPIAMVLFAGAERLVCSDATDDRFEADIYFRGAVRTANLDNLSAKLNEALSKIKGFLGSAPANNSRVLALQYVGTTSMSQVGENKVAECVVQGRIVYACARGDY